LTAKVTLSGLWNREVDGRYRRPWWLRVFRFGFDRNRPTGAKI